MIKLQGGNIYMKKMMKSVLAIFLTLGLLVACGGGSSKGAKVELGVASTQSVAVSERNPEQIEFTTVVVGVALKDDKVAYISIDESQQFAEINGDVVETSAALTKKQKGSDYGMLDASIAAGLGKEWDEQIIAVEEDLVGKTLEEVEAYFAGEEILSSSTMYLDHIQATVVKAINNTVSVEGVAKVGLGYHVGAQVKGDGLKPETTLEYAMLAVDADGKIVKALLDNAQEKAELVDGEWNLINVGKTKGELKEEYNMINASPIEKEWFEQNDAFMEYVEGKTVAEVMAVEDPTENEDLKTSVTMTISGIQASIQHASDNLVEVK